MSDDNTRRYDPLRQPANSSGNEAFGAASIASGVAQNRYAIDQANRRISLKNRPPKAPTEIAPFGSATDAPVVSSSRVYRVRTGGNIYEMAVDLRVAVASGTYTVEGFLNGVSLGTVSLTTGQTQNQAPPSSAKRAVPGDQIWCAITAVGTGGLGLGFQVFMG